MRKKWDKSSRAQAVLEARKAYIRAEKSPTAPNLAKKKLALAKALDAHCGLVVTIARKAIRRCRTLELGDLVSFGTMGLMRALEDYDPERSQFQTYSAWWVRSFINRGISNEDNTVSIPEYMMRDHRRMTKLVSAFELRFGRKPDDDELRKLAKGTQVNPERAREVFDLNTMNPVRLNAPVSKRTEEEGMRKIDLVRAPELDPAEALDDAEREAKLVAAVDCLPERFRTILRGRFWEDRTLADIAVEWGLSRERIRQLEVIALDKLRARLKSGSLLGERTGSPAAPGVASLEGSSPESENDLTLDGSSPESEKNRALRKGSSLESEKCTSSSPESEKGARSDGREEIMRTEIVRIDCDGSKRLHEAEPRKYHARASDGRTYECEELSWFDARTKARIALQTEDLVVEEVAA